MCFRDYLSDVTLNASFSVFNNTAAAIVQRRHCYSLSLLFIHLFVSLFLSLYIDVQLFIALSASTGFLWYWEEYLI